MPAMTTNETAQSLGIDPGTVRRQIEKGKLRAKKLGRDWHVTPAEVERYRRDTLGKRFGKVSAE